MFSIVQIIGLLWSSLEARCCAVAQFTAFPRRMNMRNFDANGCFVCARICTRRRKIPNPTQCMDDTSSSLEASVANLCAPVLRTNAAHDHPGILPSIVQFANARTAFRVILHLRWHYDSALRGSEELIELSGVGSCMSSSDY